MRHFEDAAHQVAQSGAPPEVVKMLRRRSDPDAQAAESVDDVMKTIARGTDADDVALCDLTGEFVYPARIRITANKLILPATTPSAADSSQAATSAFASPASRSQTTTRSM